MDEYLLGSKYSISPSVRKYLFFSNSSGEPENVLFIDHKISSSLNSDAEIHKIRDVKKYNPSGNFIKDSFFLRIPYNLSIK